VKAQVFDVISRGKSMPFDIAVVDDFELAEKGYVDAQTILDNANIMLYCLDPQNQQAVFVEIPDIADILAAPFYYISQYENATHVLKISYKVLEQLAKQVIFDDKRLILIYSMGRCGTTVTSSAFSQAEDVVSLSEPDIFTQLVQMRDFSNTNDPEISKLVKHCLLLTCKDRWNGLQPFWVIKFRSFVLEIADMIYTHFPQAKSLFLYRHVDPWGNSFARAFGGNTTPTQEQLIGFWMWSKMVVKKLDLYDLVSLEEISPGLMISFMWLNNMERCLECLDAGQKILPVRFEDLKANPELVIGKIFDYCGVYVTDTNKLLDVLNKDSQAETPISRDQLKQVDWALDPDDIAIIQRVIAEQPIINTPDYQLPGTLQLR
jgi:hypothetical protein